MDTVSTANACATRVLDTVPLVMRFIRLQMRHRRAPGLSIPQFRALTFLKRNEGASLGPLAEHLGLSLPSTSRLVENLLRRGLVLRTSSPNDRRRLTLALTDDGREIVRIARKGTQGQLAQLLSRLPPGKRVEIVAAMTTLESVFNSELAAGLGP